MKKILKYGGFLILFVVLVVAALLTYVSTALPDVGAAEDLKIDYTPARIERGSYLANAVSSCMDCHSKRDFSKFSGPPAEGTTGMGGDIFDQSVGMPGVYYAKNITPEGIGRYTDGELVRVITTGVTKEGKAMFPLMPYPYYGRMDTEDIYSLVAYLRSLKPIKNEVPLPKHDFPMNFIVNTIPKKAEPQVKPDKSDVLAYGAYLANAGGCVECHTQVEKGRIIPELAFSGGREFMFPDGSVVRSSNITPDPDTGIGKYTEAAFIARFKLYADSTYVFPTVAPGDFNTIMPWAMYCNMTSEDLAALYKYLTTVKSISNKVEKFTSKAD